MEDRNRLTVEDIVDELDLDINQARQFAANRLDMLSDVAATYRDELRKGGPLCLHHESLRYLVKELEEWISIASRAQTFKEKIPFLQAVKNEHGNTKGPLRS